MAMHGLHRILYNVAYSISSRDDTLRVLFAEARLVCRGTVTQHRARGATVKAVVNQHLALTPNFSRRANAA